MPGKRLAKEATTFVSGLSLAAGLVFSAACDDRRRFELAGAGGAGGAPAGTAGATSAAGGAGSGSGGRRAEGTGGPAESGTGSARGGATSTPVPEAAARPNCDAPDEPAVPPLQLTSIATGLVNPLYLSRVPSDDSRLLVAEQRGTVRVIRNGELLPEPLLDISDIVDDGSEMGLLGLTLHPDYPNNRRFFVMYSTNAGTEFDAPHDGVLAEYRTSPDNPDRVDESLPERRVLTVVEPESNHNGGAIEFGPDGFLYLALGDGGGGGDEHGTIGNGQALDSLLGKMLRIDVDSDDRGQYGTAPGNLSSSNPAALPEIWSYGLRNPWRFSFDACTGDMYIADVGQDELEEVNFEPAGIGGRNYGWRLMEANACFNPTSGCDADAQDLVLPVASYPHRGQGIVGSSITGGYVYRGSNIPDLRGTYLYADFISNELLALRMDRGSVALPQTSITAKLAGPRVDLISSFGQDNAGEVYLISLAGSIHRIDPATDN
jgi:glucose/arabinose dehydrogenase